MNPKVSFPIILVQKKKHSPSVTEWLWQRADEKPLCFQAGQFITLHIPYQDTILKRSYSISTAPDRNQLLFGTAVSPVPYGRGTAFLNEIAVGSTVQASGPLGKLVLGPPLAEQRLILIATGTGVSPFHSMLPELEQRLINHEVAAVKLFFGVRTKADILFEKAFCELQQRQPRFQFTACLSQEHHGPWLTHQKPGRIQQQLEQQILNPSTDKIYLCGNPAMIDAVSNYLINTVKGFSSSNLIREKYTLSPAPRDTESIHVGN